MSGLEAYLFGITLGIAIGPIALLILNTSLQDGARAGLACAAGATTADLLFALLAFHLAQQLVPLLQAHDALLQWLASLVLLAFAAHMLWQLRHWHDPAARVARSAKHHYLSALLLTLLNPLTVLAFASFATQLVTRPQQLSASLLAVMAAFGTGSVALGLVLGAQALRSLLAKPVLLRGLNAISALGIMAFAVRGLWQAAQQ